MAGSHSAKKLWGSREDGVTTSRGWVEEGVGLTSKDELCAVFCCAHSPTQALQCNKVPNLSFKMSKCFSFGSALQPMPPKTTK